jgi:murein L,D-transpeptidase YafK
MKMILCLYLALALMTPAPTPDSFKKKQLTFERVRTAYAQKWETLQKFLNFSGFKPGFNLYLAAYKKEGKLEVWLKNKEEQRYKLFRTYDFCAHSGTLGPKVKEGDGQTPEGFYQIRAFNPKSNYYLSLGINYPNAVDLARSGAQNPGTDIYIHGNCVTIGCIPLTDEKIKEVYVLAVEAKNGGQNEIPVYIFPFKMNKENMLEQKLRFPQHYGFWKTLQPAYTWFEQKRTLPEPSSL